MDTISTQSGSTAALVEAVLLVRCGSKYAFIGSHDQPSQLRPPSLQLADLEAVHSLESSLRRCVSALTSTEVEAIGLLSVEVGITSPTEALARGFGMRLVTEATVSESLQPATLKPIASPTAKEVRWLDRRDIEATLESEPSLLFQGTNVLKWATMCEENPTRLNLSSFVGLRQGFSPFSPPPPVETTDGIPVASGRAAPTLESREEEVLQKSHLGPVELTQIASEFSACCGSGAKKMNRQAFPAFISKLGISSTAASDLYRAFGGDASDDGLTLGQVQVGVAGMDPATPHGGVCGQVRAEMIHRFYNKAGNGLLSMCEFRNMLADIYSGKHMELSEESLNKLSLDQFKLFELTDSNVTLSSFLSCVGQLKFRGTSILLRLPNNVFGSKGADESSGPPSPIPMPPDHVKFEALAASSKVNILPEQGNSCENSEHDEKVSEIRLSGRRKALSLQCPEEMEVSFPRGTARSVIDKAPKRLKLNTNTKPASQQAEEYSIATHFVKVRRNGLLVDVNTLWDFISTDAVTGSVKNILSHSKPGFQRQSSLFAFDPKSSANQLLGMLRYFEQSLSRESGSDEVKPALSWGSVSMEDVGKKFISLCSRVQDILAQEERLVPMDPPVYVLGDFHGNFSDLVRFEKVLWRLGPPLTPASFLFLGDYVDRGPYGFEVVAYLFAQKVLCPQKMVLIRGNHELREMQLNFTFQQECFQKFGKVLGGKVWETMNQCFDVMPLAAVVDNKIFCTHGGIPRPCHGGGRLAAIREAPIVLTQPELQCPLAWELMWSDPIRGDALSKSVQDELHKNEGFIPNPARGTGFLFSGEALQAFLDRNSLSHVIRAHEVKATGFQLQHQGRLLTVFSSSGYCGGTNDAACVLIEGHKIRTIRLDTT